MTDVPGVRTETTEYEWIPDAPVAVPRIRAPGAPVTISACLVVRNEERTIGRCLASLAGAVDDIVVVHDGPCADRTLTIVEQAGGRAELAAAYGHSEHHTPRAYGLARGDWLLTIDADEFLSPELASQLRRLAADPTVDAYEFRWPHWDGSRYVSTRGPYKPAFFRREAVRLVGVMHMKGRVDGPVRRVDLHLEHRPLEGRRAIRAILANWRRRARIQGLELVTDLDTLPRFNYPGRLRWSRRRRLINVLSPVLILPAGVQTFVRVFVTLRHELGLRERLRFALLEGVYRAMVTAWVARYQYGGRHGRY